MSRAENAPGSIGVDPDPELVEARRARMRGEPVRLGNEARRVVEEWVGAECRRRGWALRGVNARTNHVHAVIGGAEQSAEEVMRLVKAGATRAVRRAGLVDTTPLWTRHGSTRYLWTSEEMAAAVRYVMQGQ
ncbi:MAG: hypothetical protein AB7G17_07755 [Phycisphaerales bacterium]